MTVILNPTMKRMMLHSGLSAAIHHMQILARFINAAATQATPPLSNPTLASDPPAPVERDPPCKHYIFFLSGEGEGSSLFVSMELNGLTYQGILFQKGPTSS